MKNLTRIVALGAVLTTPLAWAMPAMAGDLHSEVVKYSDLNLTTPAGAKALYSRLRAAASRVCGELDGGMRIVDRRDLIACRAAALESAVQDVNMPQLTALHRGRPAGLTASR